MAKQGDSITISRKEIEKRGGVVLLDLKEYQKLLVQAVPTYYLAGKEAEDLDELVRDGMREYEAGETVEASTITEALGKHGRKKKS
mgnify:CR=1 FL=1